jgi:hypothetical protein
MRDDVPTTGLFPAFEMVEAAGVEPMEFLSIPE